MARAVTDLRRLDVRNALLDASIETFLGVGFAATSVGDIVQRAGVPKGSFYYYFDSKDALACEALGRYARYDDDARAELLHGAGRPLARLRRYFEGYVSAFQDKAFRTGCLFGVLGLELGDVNDDVAARVRAEIDRWGRVLAAVIEEAKAAGDIVATQPADMLARVLINAWEGALLRMRVERRAAPLEEFLTVVLDGVLKPA